MNNRVRETLEGERYVHNDNMEKIREMQKGHQR